MKRRLLVCANIGTTMAVCAAFAALGMRSAGIGYTGEAWAVMWWALGASCVCFAFGSGGGKKPAA